MTITFRRLFEEANGRYLNAEEQDFLRNFAKNLDQKLTASEELRKHEGAIARETVEKVYASYPDVRQKYTHAIDSGVRDMSLVLRYVSHAAILNDPNYLNEVLIDWLRTILSGVGLTDDFLRDSYELLKIQVKAKVSPASYAVLEPYLTQVVKGLSTAPEHTPGGVY